MRFELVDRILEFSPGERIVAVKAVSRSEEYLADHFPTFPVLPGVFMLEAMIQAACWLIRESRNFAPLMILLRSAKNVTYKNFVKPGRLLRLEVICRRMAPDDSDFEGSGFCDDEEALKGRFSLTHREIVGSVVSKEMVRLRGACREAFRGLCGQTVALDAQPR